MSDIKNRWKRLTMNGKLSLNTKLGNFPPGEIAKHVNNLALRNLTFDCLWTDFTRVDVSESGLRLARARLQKLERHIKTMIQWLDEDDNTASVELMQACYNLAGSYRIKAMVLKTSIDDVQDYLDKMALADWYEANCKG